MTPFEFFHGCSLFDGLHMLCPGTWVRVRVVFVASGGAAGSLRGLLEILFSTKNWIKLKFPYVFFVFFGTTQCQVGFIGHQNSLVVAASQLFFASHLRLAALILCFLHYIK